MRSHLMRTESPSAVVADASNGVPDQVFNPNKPVTRAMFGTVFSRLLFGSKYNGNEDVWFEDHLYALQSAEIMSIINDPYRAELR